MARIAGVAGKFGLFLPLSLIAVYSAPFGYSVSAQSGAPYPPSPLIKKVDFDWSTHVRLAEGSDNWPITWADDDQQYTSWGDGGGFGGSNNTGRVSLGVGRVQGSFERYQGSNVLGGFNSAYLADFEGKSYGIIFIDGFLYMWVGPGSETESYEEARLFYSTDYGATWTPAEWAFVKADGLIMPAILNFGKNYSGARDDFVYHYFIELQGNPDQLGVHIPGRVHLLRVSKSQMLESKRSYEYFNGLDRNGDPIWSNDINIKQPVFEDPNGVGWNLAVSYNSGLDRYLLTTEHTESNQGNLGIFDAPEPWGPWTTVVYMNRSDGTEFANDFPAVPETTFFWNFANKWLSDDGKEFTLVFTGTGENDSWNTVRGSFEVTVGGPISPPAGSTPPIGATPPAGPTPPAVATPPAGSTPPAGATPSAGPTPPVGATPPAGSSVPPAPTNLAIEMTGATQISLAWTPISDSSGDVTAYKLYRDGLLVGTPSEASFIDTGLEKGASYVYEVSAINSAGIEGPKSRPASGSTSAGTSILLISIVTIVMLLLIVLVALGVILLRRRTQ